jgi:hypothetical protein
MVLLYPYFKFNTHEENNFSLAFGAFGYLKLTSTISREWLFMVKTGYADFNRISQEIEK